MKVQQVRNPVLPLARMRQLERSDGRALKGLPGQDQDQDCRARKSRQHKVAAFKRFERRCGTKVSAQLNKH